MPNRKPFFVTVDTEEIREISMPENGIEYEIEASQEEIKEIEVLFREKNTNAKNAVKYLARPFDEWGADDERNKYDDRLITIYRRLYELGTRETKQKINDLGLF
ncbi:hypothetical protein [Virgibacillus oceani]|uniref:Uncharacterized protein n=1 Tax=Virgibacillus oceani TaxID=1479511 RepID=A0A917H6N9_9BACI|nr:hypothetical protein [Virgibacillus oceani]GGG69093.1 hypothetical protein GCM10011398_11340 [Virgibacillus oceani]